MEVHDEVPGEAALPPMRLEASLVSVGAAAVALVLRGASLEARLLAHALVAIGVR